MSKRPNKCDVDCGLVRRIGKCEKDISKISDELKDFVELFKQSVKDLEKKVQESNTYDGAGPMDTKKFQDQTSENIRMLTSHVYSLQQDIDHNNQIIATFKERYDNASKHFTTKLAMDVLNEKVNSMCQTLCHVQKKTVQFESDMTDLDNCIHCVNRKIKDIEELAVKLLKLREILQRLEHLEYSNKDIYDRLERMVEITENIKLIKADREELDYLYKEKSDRSELDKFVIISQFHKLQENLSRGICQTLDQLMKNEIDWNIAQKELRGVLNLKANRADIATLKQCLNKEMESMMEVFYNMLLEQLSRCADIPPQKPKVIKNLVNYCTEVVKPKSSGRWSKCSCNQVILDLELEKKVDKRKLRKSPSTKVSNQSLIKGTDGSLYRGDNRKQSVCSK